MAVSFVSDKSLFPSIPRNFVILNAKPLLTRRDRDVRSFVTASR